ncbi:MAG: glucuronate isomerase [Ruminococcaceae bacterium]|nr:glucuronate isomerase [Oscillospiraceae bacterium]
MESASNMDFLLNTPSATKLYRECVADLPILDLCCHLDVSALADNKEITNITELWLYGDPKKWELMRVCGVNERFITGNASDFEKFREFCRIMPMLIGNPQYIACHFELQRFFDCELTINSDNCETIWKETSYKLAKQGLGAFDYVKMSGARTIFVTCAPTDSLSPYEIIRSRGTELSVLPLFSPDKCFDVNQKGIAAYFSEVGKVSSVDICDYDSFCHAYEILMDRFGAVGCRTAYHKINADHSFIKPDMHHANLILKKALYGKYAEITNDELSLWKTQLMRFFGAEYLKRNWVMQIECSPSRNSETEAILDYMSSSNVLPKTVLFSNNIIDCALVAEICKKLCRIDQNRSVAIIQGIGGIAEIGTVELETIIESIAAKTAIGSVIGIQSRAYGYGVCIMHELFRKSLCNVIGNWVDKGICPECAAAETIKKICYHNAAQYFEID